MRNSKTLFRELTDSITLDENREEIESIAFLLLSDVFGIDRASVLAGLMVPWDLDLEIRLRESIDRINRYEPVQYIAGSAEFLGRKFTVNSDVLIPRPETEELVFTAMKYIRESSTERSWRILDVGTGSGCIPITFAAEIPEAVVMATDVSEGALAVARENVIRHRVQVQLLLHNILTQPLPFRNLDLVISNPPYIPETAATTLDRNVVNFEPHLALFVKGDSPLLFYEAIAEQARTALNPGGCIFFETHEAYAEQVALHLDKHGYGNPRILRDISGKQRMVTAVLHQ